MKLFKFQLFFIIVGLLFACTPGKKDNTKQLVFNVDLKLLENKVCFDSLNICLAPPLYCTPVDNELFKQLAAAIANDTTRDTQVRIYPQQVFLNKQENTFCIISTLKGIQVNKQELEKYKLTLIAQKNYTDIKSANFEHNGLGFYQLLIITKDTVNFKLITQSGSKECIQIDYIISIKVYEKNIKAIESSIGSIEKLN